MRSYDYNQNWYPLSEIYRLKQKDDTGCGLACVAMIVGASYHDVKKQFIKQIRKIPRNFGTTADELHLLLNEYDFLAEPFENKDKWSDYEGVSIIGVFSSRPHWVVYVNLEGHNYFIDPDANLDIGYRHDFYITKPLGDGVKILGPKF